MMGILARFKVMAHSDYEVDYVLEKSADENFRPAKMYGERLRDQKFAWPVAKSLYKTSAYAGDDDGFAEGFFGTPAALHFVGMQGSRQYRNAVRQWGAPAYDWPTASFRILGECAPHDTVVFGASAFVKPKKWRAAT